MLDLLSRSDSGTAHVATLVGMNQGAYFICYVGNADGMGNIRKEELYQASAILKVHNSNYPIILFHFNFYMQVPLQQVKILDHPDFQDGFGKVWNHALLAKIIEEEVISHAIDTIITFDDYGVSGHCNHIDVHRGLWSSWNTGMSVLEHAAEDLAIKEETSFFGRLEDSQS
ncbi:putative N-acetylglucosaminyl-phosphatidylinositol de-N-acetylase [Vitis vinifera]|uniref:N-acetylglucosaminylphosphatidylinositol deacetylase n=1 Tax=Vitis vinifera TaxID=29760 RepID=A0A438FWG6_VITVI|nr:putative N-acetylglucosaminyl-phosphatidylinositol de-N-acetylase [Vitis vinifera]